MNTDLLRSHANFVAQRCEDGATIASDMWKAASEIERLQSNPLTDAICPVCKGHLRERDSLIDDCHAICFVTRRAELAEKEAERLRKFRDLVLAAITEHGGSQPEFAFIWQAEWEEIKESA